MLPELNDHLTIERSGKQFIEENVTKADARWWRNRRAIMLHPCQPQGAR